MDTWQSHFSEGALDYIEWCQRNYSGIVQHTEDPNIRMIVAKLVNILERGFVLDDNAIFKRAVVDYELYKRGEPSVLLYTGNMSSAPVGAIMMVDDEIWFHYEQGKWKHARLEEPEAHAARLGKLKEQA